MTTLTYSSPVDNTSDAGFRAWGAQLEAKMAEIGLVKTSDTGQVNWTTVTRPAYNSTGTYSVWGFPDSSLYFKITYSGSGNGPSIVYFTVKVGTGTNGTGGMTGAVSGDNGVCQNGSMTDTVNPYTTYMCLLDGMFALVFKNGVSAGSPCAFFVIGKTTDNAGANTSEGYAILHMYYGRSVYMQSVSISPAVAYNDSTWYTVVPGNVSSSIVGGNLQAYLCWMNVPRSLPFKWAAVYVPSEITPISTLSLSLVGATSHTFLALGGGARYTQSISYGFLIMYE